MLKKKSYRMKVMLTNVAGAELRPLVNTVQLQLWKKS